jgi:O-6-methylguanine DNA methyltransferase
MALEYRLGMPPRPTPTVFTRRVLYVLRRIPPGRVVTYGDVARLAGRPGAARAVGQIMRRADEPGLPYHRVIAAGGRIGGFGRHPEVKAALLAAEGLTIRRGRVAGFAARRWQGR